MKPLHVFESSTFTDLSPYRGAVREALRRVGVVDTAMEHFGARDAYPLDGPLRLVEGAEVFARIYAPATASRPRC